MDCQRTRERLEDHLDGRLTPAASAGVAGHVAECADCAAELAAREDLRAALRELPVPAPSADLWPRALARAQRRQRKRQRAWSAGGLAVAASLLVAVAVGLVTQGPATAPAGPTVVAVTPGQTERINLAFNSPARLERVTLSVALPEGVEIAGHPGKRRLSWQTTLEAGRNLLRLPVVLRGSGGVLRADLRFDGGQRSFSLQVRPSSPDVSGLLPGPAA
jgi:anti-sigma factor RsiW